MPADAYPEAHKFLPTTSLLSFDEIERLVRLFVDRLGARESTAWSVVFAAWTPCCTRSSSC